MAWKAGRVPILFLLPICALAAPDGNSGFAQSVDASQSAIAKRTDNYGDPLPEGAVARIGTVRLRQPFAWRVAFSPDGKMLVSGGSDKRITFWEPASGKELRSLAGHNDSVNGIAFSKDGKLLASGGQDSEVLVWETATGKVLHRLKKLIPSTVAFSPDGRLLASGGINSDLRVWEVASGKELQHFGGEKGYHVEALAFSPDGKLLAATGGGSRVDLWEVGTWKPTGSLQGHKERITALAFSPDGRTLYTGAFDLTVRFWDVARRKEILCIGEVKTNVSAKDPLIQSLAVAPNGKSVAAGRHDGSIFVWDTATSKELHRCKGTNLPIMSLSFSPNSKVLASGGSHGIQLWDAETGKRLDPFVETIGSPQKIVISPDAKFLAVGYDDHTLRVFDWSTRKERVSVTGPPYWIGDFAFSADSRLLAFVESPFHDEPSPTRIRLLDVASGKELSDFLKQKEMIRYFAFSPLGDTLAVWGLNDFVLWDVATRKETKRFKGPSNAVWALGYSPTGRIFVTAGQGDANVIWDPMAGKKMRHLSQGENWNGGFLAFSPDGKTVSLAGGVPRQVSGEDATHVVLWETATGRERLRLTGHKRQIKAAAFSVDGRILASTGREEVIRLWDTATGKQIGQLTGHRGWVNSLAFSPDGKTLISGGPDSTILFWDMGRISVERKEVAKDLGEERLKALWADLADSGAARAYRAIVTLTEHPGEAVSFLKGSLPQGPKADPNVIARLVSDLDDNAFAVREKASSELAKMGYRAEQALRQALRAKPSQEVQNRVNLLLGKLEDLASDPAKLRILRAVEILERIGSPDARQVLHGLQDAGEGVLSEDAKASLERLAKRAKNMP
jgi:WD40 repeat protein